MMVRLHMFTSASTSSTPSTTITVDQAKIGLPNHNNNPTLTSQSLRAIASVVASASTSVPPSGGTNSYFIHLKSYNDSVQKIFCYGCNLTKPRMAFSISQLNKMVTTKRATRFGRSERAVHQPLCKNCTPVQVTALKCSNCSRTRLLEMFSKNQRRRQKDGCLVCMECRKLLDSELVVVWSDNDDDYDDDDKKDYGDGGKIEELFVHGGFGKMEIDGTFDVEKNDPDWHNGSLNDMFL